VSNEQTPTVVGKVARAVAMILMHARVHLDEITARFLLKKLGEVFFPGIRSAKDTFSTNPPQMTREHLVGGKMLAIGCSGDIFDEHQGSDGRVDDMSATRLAANYIELPAHPQFKYLMPLVEEVHLCDTRSRVSSTMLAELIKVCHRRYSKGGEWVVKWATEALDALDRQLFFNFAATGKEQSLLDIFNRCVEEKHLVFEKTPTGERIKQGMQNEIRRSMENKNGRLTELAHIVLAFQRVSLKTPDDLMEWVLFALRCIQGDQEDYQAALALCTTRRTRGLPPKGARGQKCEKFRVEVATPKGIVPLRAMMVHTDNPMAAKAARHQDAGGQQVVIVRKLTGKGEAAHFGVFIDQRFKALHLQDFVAMYRFHELPPAEQNRLIADQNTEKWWKELQKGGNHPSSNLYFFKGQDGQAALQGSDTHEGVEPSMMGSQTLINIALQAFDPELVGHWMRSRGIKVPAAYQTPERKPMVSVAKAMPASPEPVRRSAQVPEESPSAPAGTESSSSNVSTPGWAHPNKPLRAWKKNRRNKHQARDHEGPATD